MPEPPHPDRCPEGHELGPGTASLSWDTEMRAHWLRCHACDFKVQLPLVEGGEWQVRVNGRWMPYEG